MSIRTLSIRALLVFAAMILALPAQAQIPDEFTNLKVLPKDIGKRDLVNIMRNFSGALGVRCIHCHVGEEGPGLEGFDFATDEKETKRVARIMMKMTNDINDTELAGLERKDVTRVRCVTCHHGVTKPETIDNIVLESAETDGLDSAMAKYRELREEYYGSAAYNFDAGPLNTVAETLAQQRNDVDGAIAVMQMNIEFHPDDAYCHLLLGQLYQAAGNKEAAIASVEKAIELDPENRWAKKTLEQIKAAQ